MPSRGINQLPIRAPTMPTAMSPIKPNPPPSTIRPASQPATRPTKRITRRLSPVMCIVQPSGGLVRPTHRGNSLVRQLVSGALVPSPLAILSAHTLESGCAAMSRLIVISGGQSGVDRAALDAAIARGVPYEGWCPSGGWAEDLPEAPGVLVRYPLLRETPRADPAERTELNVRDSDACLIVVDAGGIDASRGTALAEQL